MSDTRGVSIKGISNTLNIMTQQEIEARALELYPERKRQNKKGTSEYDANLPRRKAYIKGWTDAQSTLPGDSPLADHHQSSTKK